MSKRKNTKSRKKEEKIIRYENTLSRDDMIEIQAEAFYKALKKIESETSRVNQDESGDEKKGKWYLKLLFFLNVIFWPWKINKKFKVRHRIYENMLVLIVSGALKISGFVIWIYGIWAIIYQIIQISKGLIGIEILFFFSVVICVLTFGSIFALAGQAFDKETDSNQIYAFSASFIALISCVVSIIALIKSF
ncbi:MAG: hypothetical protein NC079_03380 [Clostridium sp.]|nr:hypothetical protein [Acetatifactor muris]MCM1526217.1 hypothetical protein [Bacteroides sp.]MCM1562635.1 hypothetical protein [Clostridium sp.]